MNFHTGAERVEILIVEDEALLVMEMEDRLVRLGYGVYGTAGSVDQADQLLDEKLPDGALLDVNLHGHSVAPLVHRLHQRYVPSLLLTAYSRSQLTDPTLMQLPLLRKPITDDALARALGQLVNYGRSTFARLRTTMKALPKGDAISF